MWRSAPEQGTRRAAVIRDLEVVSQDWMLFKLLLTASRFSSNVSGTEEG